MDTASIPREVELLSREEIYGMRERLGLMELEAGLKHLRQQGTRYRVAASQVRSDGTTEVRLEGGDRWLPLAMFRPAE